MVRSKISPKLISDQRRRNATFRKRRTGLKKKAMELATLCNVPTLLVCLGPQGQVEVWPEDPGEASAIIERFYSASVEHRDKHRFDVSSFFGDEVMKAAGAGAAAVLDQEGKEEGDPVQQHCSEEPLLGLILPESSLQELEWALDAKLMAIEERMGALSRAEAFLQGGEQGQLQYYGLEQGLFNNPPGLAGEETLWGMDGSWGGDLNGGLDEDPAAVLSGLHQTLMPQYPLMMHEGTATAPPSAYMPHSDNMGVMGLLDASLAFNPPLSAAALAGYPWYLNDGGYNAQYSYLNDAPCRPSSAFLDYNGADGSVPCSVNCCSTRCSVTLSGDVLSGLHQTLMPQYPLMMHGGTATAPPPAYMPIPIFPEAPFFFPPHSDNMGVMGLLDASLAFNPPLSAAALAGYPWYLNDGGYNAQYSYLNDAPCRPSSAFLDYNGADGSVPCSVNCCSTRCSVTLSGDVVMLGGSGASEQQLASSSNADGEHRREELQLYGVGGGFLQDDTVEEGFENP